MPRLEVAFLRMITLGSALVPFELQQQIDEKETEEEERKTAAFASESGHSFNNERQSQEARQITPQYFSFFHSTPHSMTKSTRLGHRCTDRTHLQLNGKVIVTGGICDT